MIVSRWFHLAYVNVFSIPSHFKIKSPFEKPGLVLDFFILGLGSQKCAGMSVILLVGGRVCFRCCSKCVHSCPSHQELSKFCLMLAKSSCSLEVGTCSTCSSVRTAAEATPMLMVIWVINEHIHMVWANFALIAKCMVYCSVYCLDKIWWDIPPQRMRHMQHTHIVEGIAKVRLCTCGSPA